ncbi:MAG TPA: hypothetical protein V6D19_13130 [Stenomitos sp.]
MNDLESKQLLLDIKKAFEGHTDNVVETIHKTVNGKIDKLTKLIEVNQTETLQWRADEIEKREQLEAKLNEYMVTTKPMIDFFHDMTSSKRILLWLMGGLASVGGFYLLIREIFVK